MTSARIVFRVDASLQIGSGHVMRCLTLAAALRDRRAECHFICRAHTGHLNDLIRKCGFAVTELPPAVSDFQLAADKGELLLPHAAWLGCDWQTDAEQTRSIVERIRPDWLVVDHYAIDSHWEAVLKPHSRKLMMIDDLADRAHSCDLLLDQNLGRETSDYANLVPEACVVLAGPKYALLRPEFAELREYSLRRRYRPRLNQLLISMGGIDNPDATSSVLDALKKCPLPSNCHIIVIVGRHAPWLQRVRAKAATMPWPCDVRVNVSNMAQLMADSDLAIGAAGSTSWERCCLGLPTLLFVLADNQKRTAEFLEKTQATLNLQLDDNLKAKLRQMFGCMTRDKNLLRNMSNNAQHITDGLGCPSVVSTLERIQFKIGGNENEITRKAS